MTLSECIAFVDSYEPNAYSAETKAHWVGECEGKVWTDVFLQHPDDFVPPVDPSPQPVRGAGDAALMVKPPHDKIYPRYLQAMIQFANGEYDRYANTMALFNDAWGEFVRWYARNYSPADYVGLPYEKPDYAYPDGYFEIPEEEEEEP